MSGELERTNQDVGAASKYEETRDRIIGLRFFEHGQISVAGTDEKSRHAVLRITMPCCLMHAVTPALLGAGIIDGYEVMNPVAVWLPKLGEDRLINPSQEVANKINYEIKFIIEKVLTVFLNTGKNLFDKADLVPILPMGTYITFRYRCRVDVLAEILTVLDGTPVAGIAEFRFALASALASILMTLGDVVSLPES